jgi:hypothetical protein
MALFFVRIRAHSAYQANMEPAMKLRALLITSLLGLTLALPAAAKTRNVTDPDYPRSLPEQGAVSVSWTDPAQFSDIRYSRNRWEAKRGDWVRQLAEHVRKSASERLPPGERLDIVITDIRRAGDYEPWHGASAQDIRFMREIYPPRITLNFKRYDASGRVVAEGERKLVDSMYMSSTSITDSDPLRYEKRMLDDWLRRDLLKPDRKAAGI